MDEMRRRLMLLAATFPAGVAAASRADDDLTHHVQHMEQVPTDAPKIGFLVYPRMVMLDLAGPMTIFRILRCNVHLVWKDRQPCATDLFPVTPTHTFSECPLDLDVLMIPGGILGTVNCMNDPQVLAFVSSRGNRARWVTSVCTGGLVLAAAGLLKGYNATAHWAVADLLPLMGARHVDERVVTDRNRMTGGGVTAGIDLGLTLASALAGEEAARNVALNIEYSPHPPFQNGTPSEAGPERTLKIRQARQGMDREARIAAEAAGKRLGL